MLHGGGCFTLSKRSVRLKQISLLLHHGVLPVSLDYRLCPETNIIDGAMSDVVDAYIWAQNRLPDVVSGAGVRLDPGKISLVGWSAGGHLAMSTAWTAKERGVAPPRAILSFYSPAIFQPELKASEEMRECHLLCCFQNVTSILRMRQIWAPHRRLLTSFPHAECHGQKYSSRCHPSL